MEKSRAKSLAMISFIESNPSDKRLIDYLRSVKEETGEEIKAQISKTAMAFCDVYAIGNNPNSTKADLERAMLRCWNVLSTHLAEVALYGKNHKHNVSLSYPHFALVDSIALTHIPAVVTHPTISKVLADVTGKDESDFNQTATIIEVKQEIEAIEEEEDEDDEDEEEEDDESEMSDEEYLASKRHLLTLENIK